MESMGFEPLTTTHYLSLKEQPNTNAPCMCLGEKIKIIIIKLIGRIK
jgi:hypothetical protein